MNATQAMAKARATGQAIMFRDGMIIHPQLGLVEDATVIRPDNAKSVADWITVPNPTWKDVVKGAADMRG